MTDTKGDYVPCPGPEFDAFMAEVLENPEAKAAFLTPSGRTYTEEAA